MATQKTENVIKKITEELLQKLKVEATLEVTKTEETYEVVVKTEESGLLIGYHGNTLNSLQLIIATLVFKKTKKWERIIVNVGDYRQKREETLKNLAQQYAQQVITSGEPTTLPYLMPAERRIIHLVLQDHPQVISESLGEGKERRITIKLKETTS